jgi:hypothetical protein
MTSVKLQKWTFGNTDAAVKLAAHLNYLNDRYITTKITRLWQETNNRIQEIWEMNTFKGVSLEVTELALDSVYRNVDQVLHKMENSISTYLNDTLATSLLRNIIIGKIRNLRKRIAMAYAISNHKRKVFDKYFANNWSGFRDLGEKAFAQVRMVDVDIITSSMTLQDYIQKFDKKVKNYLNIHKK